MLSIKPNGGKKGIPAQIGIKKKKCQCGRDVSEKRLGRNMAVRGKEAVSVILNMQYNYM